MKRTIVPSVLVILAAVSIALGHDPRTVAKDFTHTMIIEGSGKLSMSYKSLHWNEAAYASFKKNDQLRTRVLNAVWKKIGKLESEFDFVLGGTKVAKGSYDLGITFDANDNFSLILGSAGKDTVIALKTASDGPLVDFLAFDIRPADPNKPDTFLVEGRGGKFRSSAELTVPALAAHEHGEMKK